MVAFYDRFVVWNFETDKLAFEISRDYVKSIKRIANSNIYIVRTDKSEVKLLNIIKLDREDF